MTTPPDLPPVDLEGLSVAWASVRNAYDIDDARGDVQTMLDALPALLAEVRALREANARLEAHADALLSKVDALVVTAACHTPGYSATCACSFDAAGDICAHHSPKLVTAIRERDAAREEVARLRAALTMTLHLIEDVDCVRDGGPAECPFTDEVNEAGTEFMVAEATARAALAPRPEAGTGG